MSRFRERGFTLLELMVAVSILAILLVAAVPNFKKWLANTKVRTVAEGISNGLRFAQTEAAKNSRQVRFQLTNSLYGPGTDGGTVAASANGSNWAVTMVPLLKGSSGSLEASQYLAGGNLGAVANGVAINGPSVTTFNSIGRPTVGAGDGAYVVNTLITYNISVTSADHPLRITVSPSGQIRACDPSRLISASPDGCPP